MSEFGKYPVSESGSELDRFAHDDAAYVLGALSDEERQEFEDHLTTCAACRARVDEVRGVPALLAGVSTADLADEPLPDTLLPGLLRRAGHRRRQQRWLVGGLAAVAAACLVALAVAFWPSSSTANPSRSPARALQPVVTSPVKATARLTAESWGTEIELHCHYVEGVNRSFPYRLVVVDRHGTHEDPGSWQLPPDADVDYTAGTALRPADIAQVQITLASGQPILQLTN